MIRLNVSAGLAAVAVALVSVFAPVDAPRALAQAQDTPISHTHSDTLETVPVFVTREVVAATTSPADTSAGETPDETASSLSELVASMPRDVALDSELSCLAGAIYFEARGEPLDGQLAVAEVIVNRAASGRFPASYCGVVLQKSQFSFIRGGRMPAVPESSLTYQRAKAIAQIAHRDLWDSRAEKALYFHAARVSPAWNGKKMAARIGNHVFYR